MVSTRININTKRKHKTERESLEARDLRGDSSSKTDRRLKTRAPSTARAHPKPIKRVLKLTPSGLQLHTLYQGLTGGKKDSETYRLTLKGLI